MSPLEQFYRDCAWLPLHAFVWVVTDWRWLLGSLVAHWFYNIVRAREHD